MSKVPTHLQHTGQLITYRPQQQLTGTYLAGFNWTLYGTGTFRTYPSEEQATFLLKRYVNKLQQALQFGRKDVAYYAVLEDRTPGLGTKAVKRHWHYLLSCPEDKNLLSVAKVLWLENGFAKVQAFNPELDCTFYMSKLAHTGAVIVDYNGGSLRYSGPEDLLSANSQQAYIEDRHQGLAFGEYLRTRKP